MTADPSPAGSATPRADRRYRRLVAALALLYLAVLGAGFLSPDDPLAQNRDLPFAPPTRLHFVDPAGRVHLRPFVHPLVLRPGSLEEYEEDHSRTYPLRFFVTGARYTVLGPLQFDRHLFGTDSPSRVFLIGSDGFGRDLLSRLLYGGQISLFAGLLGAALSVAAAIVLGSAAGFYGGWIDAAIMRGAELFLALPWLYLLFAVRMSLPLHIEPGQAFLLIVTIVGLVGWARPARLIRGVVLSASGRDYVLAARSSGASDSYLIRRHVLPQVMGVALTQAALLVPQYILAEVTLSYFGLGVGEPAPSLGNMLAGLQRYHVMASYWWMFLPGIALIPVFLLYYVLADALHQRVSTVSLSIPG